MGQDVDLAATVARIEHCIESSEDEVTASNTSDTDDIYWDLERAGSRVRI